MKIILVLLSVLCLSACSSSSNSSNPNGNGGGVVTEFGKKMSGEWVSECIQGEKGPFKDVLDLKENGMGQRTLTQYNDRTCTGAIKSTQGPLAITYSVDDLPDGSAKVVLTQGQNRFQVTITVMGDTMQIADQSGAFRYTRSQSSTNPQPDAPGQKPPSQTPVQGEDSFDRLALGAWLSQTCYPYQNSTSARQQLNVIGRGRATVLMQVYASQDCSGRARAERSQNVNYRIVHFANGRGQIAVNDQISEVFFEGARNERMTLIDANGTTVFQKMD